jgi:hypothetical protein
LWGKFVDCLDFFGRFCTTEESFFEFYPSGQVVFGVDEVFWERLSFCGGPGSWMTGIPTGCRSDAVLEGNQGL